MFNQYCNFTSGECNESKECKVKYNISLLNKDEDESKAFLTLNVIRSGEEHCHLEKKKQIRGKQIFRNFS